MMREELRIEYLNDVNGMGFSFETWLIDQVNKLRESTPRYSFTHGIRLRGELNAIPVGRPVFVPALALFGTVVEREDGRLFWLVRPREHFPSDAIWKMWNTRFSLKEAGNPHLAEAGGPRWRVRLEGNDIKRCSIVWALHHKKWQTWLDHKDRNRLNDRIDNLRIASPSQNAANSTISSTNRSGVKGVRWEKARKKWAVSIGSSGKSIWIGLFDDLLEAKAARAAAAQKYHGEFACDGEPAKMDEHVRISKRPIGNRLATNGARSNGLGQSVKSNGAQSVVVRTAIIRTVVIRTERPIGHCINARTVVCHSLAKRRRIRKLP